MIPALAASIMPRTNLVSPLTSRCEIDRDLPHSEFLLADSNAAGFYDVEIAVDGESLGSVADVLFAVPAGSHLYGTDHAESDFDLKGVYLESFESIVLGRDRETRRFRTSEGAHATSGPGDVDAEFLELRKFLRDALDGHPYAVEMLHAPRNLELLRTELWEQIRNRRDRIVSARVDPFVGYCRAQARRYTDKADRLTAIEAVLEVLESADRGARIESVVDELPTDAEHVGVVEQPIRGQPGPVELLRVADKRFELRARIAKAVDSLRSVRDAYGDRVRNAAAGEPDWKAVAHAYRIAFELRELLSTGSLAFPLEQADFLGRVRRGDIPYEQVERELPDLVDEALETPTDLPDSPDDAFWTDWLVETYSQRLSSR